MQSAAAGLLLLLVLGAATTAEAFRGLRVAGAGARAAVGGSSEGDKTIGKIVKLLKDMLEDSEKEGEEEAELFGKFKCYCDDNTKEKTESVEKLTKEIGLLENKIEELKSSSALLSSQSAQLKTEMDENEQAQDTAKAVRKEEKEAFEKSEADLEAAVEQLGKAIDVLAAIGADQTSKASAEHEQFMADYKKKQEKSLLKVRDSVKQALIAANSFLTPEQRLKAAALLQAPFTGTYSTQSGTIFGILSTMKETFESNLESAQSAEKAAKKAHEELIKTKEEEFKTMEESYDGKQETLSDNDDELSKKKTSLSGAKKDKEDDEEFLAELTEKCEKKTKEWESRKLFRANEQAAISQAISILDNDQAFSAFGKVDATSTGATGLLQLSSVQRRAPQSHAVDGEAKSRRSVLRLLQGAAHSGHSKRLARIASLLTLGNPFTKVLEAIEKMKEVIVKEGNVDKEQFDWCKDEQKENKDQVKDKEKAIDDLGKGIDDLKETMNDPETGLKVQIEEAEEDLEKNSKNQAEETKTRREENAVYHKTVSNAEDAAGILKKAISALERYYEKLEEAQEKEMEFVQEDPEPPETWSGSYSGQSENGNKALEMLKFVLKETEKEEDTAHTNEQEAQKEYEKSMKELKDEESDLQDGLIENRKLLADAQKELEEKHMELETTEREKTALERYLKQIKPGCDWIDKNFDAREKAREEETKALNKAKDLLKESPAFAAAKTADKHEAWGECKEKCIEDDAHADCKACLAGVTVPGYCASHKDTPGC